MNRLSSTIFALSSGSLPSGVAVVRISGPRVRFAIETIALRVPSRRYLQLVPIMSAEGELLDRGLVAYFPGPASFTGEDVAEIHLHGGRAVVARVMAELANLGLEHAEAGEFTRRSFVNGKLDLTEAEALGDLIEAQTDVQRKLALKNAGGEQRRLYEAWRARIIDARAMIEAELDFSDEGDVAGSSMSGPWTDLAALRSEVALHLFRVKEGEIAREGLKVVLAGPPNAGKSSLLNHLAGRDVAIVTPEPGTTRDVLEVGLDLGGVKVRVFDTAGLRIGSDMVEEIGIQRARETIADADVVLLLAEAGSSHVIVDTAATVIPVVSKVDVRDANAGIGVSVKTGQGIHALLSLLRREASDRANRALDGVVPTQARHRGILQRMLIGLDEALDPVSALELRAEGLRLAGDAVGRLTGDIHSEEVLGALFARFCIGK